MNEPVLESTSSIDEINLELLHEVEILRLRVKLQGKLLNTIDGRTREIYNNHDIPAAALNIVELINNDFVVHDQLMDDEIDAIFSSRAALHPVHPSTP